MMGCVKGGYRMGRILVGWEWEFSTGIHRTEGVDSSKHYSGGDLWWA